MSARLGMYYINYKYNKFENVFGCVFLADIISERLINEHTKNNNSHEPSSSRCRFDGTITWQTILFQFICIFLWHGIVVLCMWILDFGIFLAFFGNLFGALLLSLFCCEVQIVIHLSLFWNIRDPKLFFIPENNEKFGQMDIFEGRSESLTKHLNKKEKNNHSTRE